MIFDDLKLSELMENSFQRLVIASFKKSIFIFDFEITFKKITVFSNSVKLNLVFELRMSIIILKNYFK